MKPRSFFAFLLPWLGLAALANAATRLAVWSTPAARDEAALLTAALSAPAGALGYELLDRDELAHVIAEQVAAADGEAAGALRAGRLLGAAGVVWLEEVKRAEGSTLILRLSAVDSGLVAGWRLDEMATPAGADWAARAARQLEAWRPRLAVSREAARAVSLLNLRRAGGSPGPENAAREQALTLVLGEALANSPRLRVLERWRLDDLALEAALGGAAQDEFWRGAALVDGSFTEAAGEIALTMRLRSGGGGEARWTLRGTNAGQVVTDVAAELTRRLLNDPFAGPWDRAAEAREFLEEARWAARLNRHAKVVEAAEAAIVLGGETPELRRLRYLARGRLVWGGRQSVLLHDGDVAMQMNPPGLRLAAPPLERVEAARQVLALFADHRARPEGRAQDERPAGPQRMVPGPGGSMRMRHSTQAEMDAVELLGGAARVLRDGYLATVLDAPMREALAELRRAARGTLAREAAAPGPGLRPRAPGAGLPPVAPPGPFHDFEDSLWIVAYAHGPLWAESLADHQAWAAGLLAAETDADLFASLLRLKNPRRAEAWEVDWATRDGAAARAQWAAKAREWLRAEDAALRVAGAFQLLALNAPFEMPMVHEGFGEGVEPPPEWARFGSREEQTARAAEAVQALAAERERPGGEGEALPRAYVDAAERILNGRVPEQARAAWAALRAPRASGPSAPRPVSVSALQEPRVRQAKIPMVLHWLTPDARVPATGLDDYNARRGIRWAARDNGRVRVISEETDPATRGRRFVLSEIELTGFRTRKLGAWEPRGPRDFNDHLGFPGFALLGERVFAWEGGELWRRDLDGGSAARVELPVQGQARLWALGGRLYVASNEGGILRVDPASGAWEMLADSRRRPAEGPLDDRFRYEVHRMWLGGDGALRAAVGLVEGNEVYRRDELGRSWTLEGRKPHANLPGFLYQRAESVAWLEGIELATPGHGRAELERLLRDVARAGDWRVPDGFSLGGHYAGEPHASLLGGMSRGGDVWGLFYFWREPRRSPRLVWMPAPETGRESVSVELEMPDGLLAHLSANPSDMLYGGIGGEYARFLTGPEGLVIYATGSPVLWFISKARLEAAGLEWR
jgi:hypothetical protein